MKAFQIRDNWSFDNLQLVDVPEPSPGPGQVKLRMRAASLNYRDLVVPLRGYGNLTGNLPLIPISDGVGEVVEVGEGVTRAKVGDRVLPAFFQRWVAGPMRATTGLSSLGAPVDGAMAEYRVFDAEGVCQAPAHLSHEAAATLPCAALTAWSALVTEGHVKAGDTVLVQGTGGVSLFALQFAKMHGARVIVTSSSDDKLARARALGADECINYRSEPEWGRLAHKLAGGDGVDHVVEVGGEKTLAQSLRAVRPGGTISMIGILSGGKLEASLGLVVTRYVRLQGITVGHRTSFEEMLRAVAQHRLEPVIDRVFAFEELKEAMTYLKQGAHFGKICLRHPGTPS